MARLVLLFAACLAAVAAQFQGVGTDVSGGVGPGGPIGPVDPGTTQQATCPPRSGVYNGYCYTVFNGFFNNWWFGYQQCRHLNADMVSFEDQAELDWFKGWFKKNFFDPHGGRVIDLWTASMLNKDGEWTNHKISGETAMAVTDWDVNQPATQFGLEPACSIMVVTKQEAKQHVISCHNTNKYRLDYVCKQTPESIPTQFRQPSSGVIG